MNVVEQIALVIPHELLPGLADGSLYRDAGVVRDAATKQFVAFLDEAAEPLSKELAKNTTKVAERLSTHTNRAIEAARQNKQAALAIGGTVLAVSGAAAVGITLYHRGASRKAVTARVDQQSALVQFSSSMSAYWEAAQIGQVTLELLTAAEDDLKALEARGVQLDPDNPDVRRTVELARTYTDSLVAANPQIDIARGPMEETADPVKQLVNEFRIQRALFTRAGRPALGTDHIA